MMPKSIAATRPSGKREQIALVQIGVEKPVDHRLAKEAADEDRGQSLGIVAGGDQLVALAELDAVEPFQRQHPARGPPPVDVGNVEARLGDHVFLELGGGGGLARADRARGAVHCLK